MQFLNSGTSGTPTSLQSLEYTYDAAGNVDWIKDWKAGSPQLQDFGYDALNRLTSAVVSGGSNGLYNETHTYNANANLATTARVDTFSITTPAAAAPVSDYKTVSYSPPTTSLLEADQSALMQTSTLASFTYDGDGRQVKAVVGSTTTYYIGSHYQIEDGVVTKYYFAGAQRVAMRKNGTLYYLLADHLGSTSLTTNTNGAVVSELRYKACPLRFTPGVLREGETRYSSGTTYTNYRYTGQREEPSFGLYFYNARWYDPCINSQS